MIIVKIIGGLGNQMFQYAYALSLKQAGYDVKIDSSAFLTYSLHSGFELSGYQISLPIAEKSDINFMGVGSYFDKLVRKLGGNRKVIIEESLLFNEKLSLPDDNRYIEGYFQNENYFVKIRQLLLDEFIIKTPLSRYAISIEKKILNSSSPTSLHVRRGDYINDESTNKVHGSCGLEYFTKALALISEMHPDYECFVFSDDMEWVKKNIVGDNITYIESDEVRLPHEDIYLMSMCDNNIIANSSFSWWGAWLNSNITKTVIAPSKWFADPDKNDEGADIVPSHWVRI